MYKILLFTLCLISYSAIYSQQNIVEGQEWVIKNDSKITTPLVLCEFWATWCGPCIKAMPHVEYLTEKNKELITAVYVSDESSYTIKKWMDRKDAHFNSLSDPKKVNLEKFNINAIPVSIILGPDGEIVWRGYPSSLTQDFFDKLSKKYAKKKGSSKRITLYNNAYKVKNKSFKTFKSNGNKLNFKTTEPIEYNVIRDSVNYDFNGNIIQLISDVYEYPVAQIQTKLELDKNYEINIKHLSNAKRTKLLKAFIEDELKLNIDKREEKVSTFKIIAKKDVEGLSSLMYDFTENNAKYFADDQSVQIDNATAEEMIEILNQFSDYHFIAKGFNKKIYDWNIHYKFNALTLDQFVNEMNCKVEESETKLKYLDVVQN